MIQRSWQYLKLRLLSSNFRSPYLLFKVSLLTILLAVIYWGLIASDRYVSEARIVVDRTDLGGGQSMDFVAAITGGSNGKDLMLLREHLRSVDMLNKLDEKLDLRSHYSDKRYDVISRMWFKDSWQEFFHKHFLTRVSVEMDNLAGVLRIRAQAYTPEMAHAVAESLVEEGEAFMNDMAHRLAREQVAFLEKQVAQIGERVSKARSNIVEYQSATGLVSPQATVEALASIVAKLEAQVAELKARRQAISGYLSPNAPEIAQLTLHIDALERQLREEQARLASPKGPTLSRTVEEFQRLQMEVEFAQDIYRSALVALEKGRVEATRTLKKVSVLQSPTRPQYPLEPRRIYNITVFAVSVLIIVGIVQMLVAIIRDHRD